MKYFFIFSLLFVPFEVRQEVNDVPKGKQWNRWANNKFVVCSINDTQGKYLHDNLEHIKKWSLTRWGLPDVSFRNECRILCVDDKVFYKSLFTLEQTKVEVRKDISVIFLLGSERPSRTIPVPLTEVCLVEYERQNNVKFGWWSHRGIALLNGSIPDIRKNLVDLHAYVSNDTTLYFGKGLFSMTEEGYNRESRENRDKFDKCAVAACLLFRKEFGQDKFLRVLPNASEGVLKRLYGFENYNQFDASFKRYLLDLTNDVIKGRTPDSYLQIKAKALSYSKIKSNSWSVLMEEVTITSLVSWVSGISLVRA